MQLCGICRWFDPFILLGYWNEEASGTSWGVFGESGTEYQCLKMLVSEGITPGLSTRILTLRSTNLKLRQWTFLTLTSTSVLTLVLNWNMHQQEIEFRASCTQYPGLHWSQLKKMYPLRSHLTPSLVHYLTSIVFENTENLESQKDPQPRNNWIKKLQKVCMTRSMDKDFSLYPKELVIG